MSVTGLDPASLLSQPQAGWSCPDAAEYVAGKRFHVTGGGGTIGRAVVSLLIEYGAESVYAIDRDEGRLASVPDGCYRVLADVSRLYPCLPRPDAVIHCAAYKHVDGLQDAPLQATINNVDATATVAEWARTNRARMVYLSTDKAINPVGVLGLTKALGEHVARSIANANVVRLVNVIGSSGSVVERWARQITDGNLPTVCNGDHLRHYVSERNAANVVLSALLAPDRTDLIPAEYETIRTGELVGRLLAVMGQTDREYVVTGDRPGERATEPVVPDGECPCECYGAAVATRGELVSGGNDGRRPMRVLRG